MFDCLLITDLSLVYNGIAIPTDGTGLVSIAGIPTDNSTSGLVCIAHSQGTGTSSRLQWYMNGFQITEKYGYFGWRSHSVIANGFEKSALKRVSGISASEGVLFCCRGRNSQHAVAMGMFYPSEHYTMLCCITCLCGSYNEIKECEDSY